MKLTALTTIICMFSVVIPTQSGDIIYDYDYNNFDEIFPQGDGDNDFHLYKYANIDDIFDEKYEGTNVGGAFLVKGDSWQETDVYEVYPASITATFYCGSTEAEEGGNSLEIAVAGGGSTLDYSYICQERGWHYNYTWNPSFSGVPSDGFQVILQAYNATINKAYGFDKLRITTTKKPPQLLQRDNNTSSNDPRKNTSSNDPRKKHLQQRPPKKHLQQRPLKKTPPITIPEKKHLQ